eukprot:scaffold1609_cov252-Pinguiococcus_pyrenoidosus.AAC.5
MASAYGSLVPPRPKQAVLIGMAPSISPVPFGVNPHFQEPFERSFAKLAALGRIGRRSRADARARLAHPNNRLMKHEPTRDSHWPEETRMPLGRCIPNERDLLSTVEVCRKVSPSFVPCPPFFPCPSLNPLRQPNEPAQASARRGTGPLALRGAP